MIMLNNEQEAHLAKNINSIVKAWRIINHSGKEICVTEHDEDLNIAGKIFKAKASEIGLIENQTMLDANRGLFIGSLEDETIKAEEVKCGIWNGANFEIYAIDWQKPDINQLIWGGIIGDIKLRQFGYEFELLGYETQLNQNIGRKFTSKCAANIGDENCNISPDNAYKISGTISNILNAFNINIVLNEAIEINDFSNGNICFKSGKLKFINNKIKTINKITQNYEISLQNELLILPQIGDLVEITKFCDKEFSTCKLKFQNQRNFYGFPHLPGEGIIYASPK